MEQSTRPKHSNCLIISIVVLLVLFTICKFFWIVYIPPVGDTELDSVSTDPHILQEMQTAETGKTGLVFRYTRPVPYWIFQAVSSFTPYTVPLGRSLTTVMMLVFLIMLYMFLKNILQPITAIYSVFILFTSYQFFIPRYRPHRT